MKLKKLQLHGFKSFAQKSEFIFDRPIAAIVGPNGSGKSNVVESIRFVLGEQSMKSLRGSAGTDLIFKGSGKTRSMNRAAVSITFDNSDRVFSLSSVDNAKVSLDFDEITLSREIYSDGATKYILNGHEVRLKDIVEVIASVNIGSSGHHIISQGEADRLLNANAKERRHMLEDALGLKIYQYRIKESSRKLDKTRENLKESGALRRELAPHLKFLRRQVEKIEQAKVMRTELHEKYLGYLSTQEAFLEAQKQSFTGQRNKINVQLVDLRGKLDAARATLEATEESPEERELASLGKQQTELHKLRDDLTRKLGRVEGMLEVAKSMSTPDTQKPSAQKLIDLAEVEDLIASIDEDIQKLTNLSVLEKIQLGLKTLRSKLLDFISSKKGGEGETVSTPSHDPAKIVALEISYKELSDSLASLQTQEDGLQSKVRVLKAKLAEARSGMKEREQAYFAMKNQANELESQLNLIQVREESVMTSLQSFQEEVDEATTLLGQEVLAYKTQEIAHDFSDLEKLDVGTLTKNLENERRTIERLKIKIEEVGGGGGTEIMDEYEETLERDQFLEREMLDLEASIASLDAVIADLREQLHREFEVGLQKISAQFQEFFVTMFGGGSAKLSLVDIQKRKKKTDSEGLPGDLDIQEEEDKATEQGIDINVKLPRKKVQDLQMLSGGERSLTSIALLFALSQVNPPPFLVLDETDAALDEANSQKYGDMIENLAKVSQLIVVTHNRETMSRADILYGVTLDASASSQLLSVKFDDAVAYAK